MPATSSAPLSWSSWIFGYLVPNTKQWQNILLATSCLFFAHFLFVQLYSYSQRALFYSMLRRSRSCWLEWLFLSHSAQAQLSDYLACTVVLFGGVFCQWDKISLLNIFLCLCLFAFFMLCICYLSRTLFLFFYNRLWASPSFISFRRPTFGLLIRVKVSPCRQIMFTLQCFGIKW